MLHIRFSLTIIYVLFLHSILIAQPTQFALYQNYPNPFDTTGTSIPFALPRDCSLNLWIDDTSGHLVATLVSGNIGSGVHEVNFAVTDSLGIVTISEGIYLCKMLAMAVDTILFRDSIYIEFRRGNPMLGVWNKFDGPTQTIQYNFLSTDSLCSTIQLPESLYTFCGGYTTYREIPLPELNLFLDGVRINRCIFSILNNVMAIECSGNGDSLPHSFSDPSVFHKLVTDAPDVPAVPLAYSLSQNYPNPFNPTTTIQFSLPVEQYVTLKVFSVLGEEVVTLVSQNLVGGTYNLQWNAGNATSGVYIYRLQAGQFTQSKKLILLR